MTTDPTLAETLISLASDIDAIAAKLDAAAKRMAETASRVWDAKLLTPPVDSGVRPKLYAITLDAARRITRNGDTLTKSRLFNEMRDVDCVSIKEQEREPLWEYVTAGKGE